ncbi:MAG: TRAP transporter substrate-binding protein [Rhodospirillales bacterium]|nr:TRAP transporter substrate-binding protein [Rhodospirillales bacterium]
MSSTPPNPAPRRAGLTRRQTLAAGLAVPASFAILTRPADAAEFVFKYGNNVPDTYPLNIRVKAAAARLREATHGRFDLQTFSNGTLGTDTDMLSQVRTGAIQMFTTSGLVLSTLVPLAAINAVGFAFKDYAQVWAAMDGKLGDIVRATIAKSGLHAMDKIFDIGFRQTTSSTHPIRTAADFAGFKIRIPPSALGVAMFKALGAAPTTLNFAEVYTALQTHVVDGQENPLSIIEAVKFYEVQKYCSLTNHMWDGFWMVVNGPAWKRLPPDIQALVSKELGQAAIEDRADIAALDAGLKAKLQSQGLTFNAPDPASFRAMLQKSGFYATWRGKFGAEAWSALEQVVGKLA